MNKPAPIFVPKPHDFSRVIVSTMKDEGPYILDWLAYHMRIGFTHFVVLTNDCSDGTEKILRNLEQAGIVTHQNNKPPYPRGIQKTGWKRASRLAAVEQAEWIMALDVDEYLQLNIGHGTLNEMFRQLDGQAVAISFVWQVIGNQGVQKIVDKPVIEQFTKSAHPLQANPYTIRGFKTLYRNRLFKELGTHRPHDPQMAPIAGRHWVSGDGVPIDILYKEPYWCVWDTGFLFGGAMGRVFHYALRSKEAFMLKIIRGFVNRTGKGPRAQTSPLEYWRVFDWNVVNAGGNMDVKAINSQATKKALLEIPKIERLHQKAVAHHQSQAEAVWRDYPDLRDEFEQIWELPPKTELNPEDPVLQQGTNKNLLFDAQSFLDDKAESVIKSTFISNYYSSLTKI